MKITETKYQNIKIIYNPSIDNIKIGDFIKFSKDENSIIGQVTKISSSCVDDDFSTAELTFVLTQKFNTIKPWRGENLPVNTKCELIDEDYLSAMFPIDLNEKTLNFGSFLQFESKYTDLPYKKFAAPAYVGYDRIQDSEKLLQMFAYNFDNLNENFVVLDFKGTVQIPGAYRILAGEDLKLPFNDFTLSETGYRLLEGLSTECKVIVEDVLQEISQYSKGVKNHFVPIDSLISVVDEMYKTYRLNPLMMFKNKLLRLVKSHIFANQPREVNAIYNAMKSHNVVIVDFSYIPADWHKEFISNILQMNKTEKASFYLYITLDEYNSDNKILNKLLFKTLSNGIKPILASNYRYISFENIYEFSKNIFLFKIRTPFTRKQDLYEITQSLPDESFVINGTLTDGLILCSVLGQHEEKIFIQKKNNKFEEIEEVNIINTKPDNFVLKIQENDIKNLNTVGLQNAIKSQEIQPKGEIETSVNTDLLNQSLTISEDTKNTLIEQVPNDNITQNSSEVVQQNEPQLVPDTPKSVQEIEIKNNVEENNDTIQTSPVENLPVNVDETNQLKNIEDSLEPVEISENISNFEETDEILEDIQNIDEIQEINVNEENLEEIETVNSDIDIAKNSENEEDTNIDEEMDDELLDLLNEPDLNEADNETLEDFLNEVETLENQQVQVQVPPKKEFTPSGKTEIPIYDTNYNKDKDAQQKPINLQEGDMVKHKKYGVGVIKKMMPHQDKFLCCIDFDAGFRRLLDPEISDLEKIS